MLTIKDVCFSYFSEYGEVNVLEHLNLSIQKDSFVAIVGPSGCGKSTILSLIAGLLQPTSGSITFYSDAFQPPGIGYMLQHDHLLEWRTIERNLFLGLEIQHKLNSASKQYVYNLIQKYDLEHTLNQRPSALSGGMRQRIALIRTLATNPDLLLLDEPFSALDYQTRLLVSKDVYQMIKNEKKTAILVTHDIAEAVAMADIVYVLSKSPCQIKKCFSILFEKEGITRETVRTSPLFQKYFDQIWEVLQHESYEDSIS